MGDPPTRISEDTVFQMHISETQGFYGLMLALASTFLGGTLVFVEWLLPEPTTLTFVLLVLGWVFLVVSLIFLGIVRLLNVRASHFVLMKEHERVKKICRRNRKIGNISCLLLAIGIVLISVCGIVALAQRSFGQKEKSDAGRYEKIRGASREIRPILGRRGARGR